MGCGYVLVCSTVCVVVSLAKPTFVLKIILLFGVRSTKRKTRLVKTCTRVPRIILQDKHYNYHQQDQLYGGGRTSRGKFAGHILCLPFYRKKKLKLQLRTNFAFSASSHHFLDIRISNWTVAQHSNKCPWIKVKVDHIIVYTQWFDGEHQSL